MKRTELIRLLAAQPEAPRTIHFGKYCWSQIQHLGWLSGFLFGLIGSLGMGFFIASIYANAGMEELLTAIVIGGLFLLVFVIFTIFPLLRYRLLRNGILGVGSVIEIEPHANSDATFKALKNGGMAVGKWKVQAQGHTFVDDFEIDEEWWQELVVGSQVKVLVASKGDIVIEALEIAADARTADGGSPNAGQ